MLENFTTKFKKKGKKEQSDKSKDAAKERLHLVLMQDRANVSADFLDMMKQEIVDVIKKYIDVDENEMDVKLANKSNDDGTSGAPALFANIPIVSINEEKRKESIEVGKAKKVEEEPSDVDEKPKATKTTKKTTTATKKTVSAKKSTAKTTKTTKKVAKKTTKKEDEDLGEDGESKTVKKTATRKKTAKKE